MFTSGEAPIVLSYATDPAYHYETEKSLRYQVVPTEEGFYRQIEGMALSKAQSIGHWQKNLLTSC